MPSVVTNMYQYDDYDHALVNQRVLQFRRQVGQRLSGELSEDEFKQLRLRNGLYLQRHAYMLRVAVPYGLLSAEQLRTLGHIARRYDRGFGHFTTRQNIQFNWPELDKVPDILQDLAAVQMHAIQTSGNCIRNITSDPLAGVAADEIADPRPYCELLRQWSTLHPEFSWLPRKFKVAVTGAREDRVALRFHDIGLRLVETDAGERGFRVYVGGGMGRTPVIGEVIREFLPEQDMVSYFEAILRVYNLKGRRDNLYKSRIKILVKALGIDEFRDLVEREWQSIRHGPLALTAADVNAMKRFFPEPKRWLDSGDDARFRRWLLDTRFATWYRQNTQEHRVKGYRIVQVSLKAPGIPPGDITAEQMETLADLAELYSLGEIRATHEQNLVLPEVRVRDLVELWQALDATGLATPNIGTVNDIICCPGLDYCALANASSIPVAREINQRFSGLEQLFELGDIKIKISGCVNACGHHHVGHIGILGAEKQGEEWYQFTLGGSAADDAAVGERLGPSIAADQVGDAVEALTQAYLKQRRDGESFLDTWRRVGTEPFRESVYANHPKPIRRRKRLAAGG